MNRLPRESARNDRRNDWRNDWPIYIVALLTLLMFLPLCGHEFTWWDDWATVHQNKWLNPPTFRAIGHYCTSIAYGLYMPLTYAMWIALAYLARVQPPDEHNIALNPWVFHSANVVVHVISAIFVFLLLRRLVKRDWPACFGALLFALHPVQVEPVAWISGLKDVLAGCLSIIALWRFVVRAQDRDDWKPDTIGTIAFILSMLAKPSAVIVPLIALGIDWLLIRKSFRSAIRATWIWFVLAIPIVIVARIAQDVTGIPKAPLWSRPLIATDALAFYLCKIAAPIWLAADYGRRPAVVIAHGWLYWTWLAPTCLAIVVLALRKKFPWLAAAAFVFLAALLPVCGLTTFQYQFTSTVADHYLYVAMLGPALALCFALRNFRPQIAYPAAALWLLALSVRTITLEPVWDDDRSLFTHNLAVNPNSIVALNNLGSLEMSEGHYDKSLKLFDRAIEVFPDYPNPYENASRALTMKGDIDGSIAMIKKSIDIRARLPRTLFPNYMDDYNVLGQILMSRGRYAEAIEQFEALLKVKPGDAEAQKNLAIAREKINPPKH